MHSERITEEIWGEISDSRKVKRYTLSNGELSVSVMDLGASVQRVVFRGLDMALSFPKAKLYEKFFFACFGATVGRYAGRIAGGQFRLDGREYRLTQNHNGHHLHGGALGFSRKIWEGSVIGDDCVQFTLLSPDGEEGYPGNLNVSVSYRVTRDNALEITFRAVSDRDTVINLTNHSYFNPNGIDTRFSLFRKPPKTDNRDVQLFINADHTLKLDGNDIPTGKQLPVDGTPFDFRTPKMLADDDPSHGGFDHTFVLNPHETEQPVAFATGLKSGVTIECFTDQPAVQLFTLGNPGGAFALETQHFPDSPNHPEFPGTVLRAGEIFTSTTKYRFFHD